MTLSEKRRLVNTMIDFDPDVTIAMYEKAVQRRTELEQSDYHLKKYNKRKSA